jgi:hypothetical protein
LDDRIKEYGALAALVDKTTNIFLLAFNAGDHPKMVDIFQRLHAVTAKVVSENIEYMVEVKKLRQAFQHEEDRVRSEWETKLANVRNDLLATRELLRQAECGEHKPRRKLRIRR